MIEIEKPECAHENKSYCWRVLSNGQRRFGIQCLRCGSWYAVSTKKLHPQILDAPDYDEKITNAWDEKIKEYYNFDGVRRQKEFEAKKESFREALAEYYQSEEWIRKRGLRHRLNEKLFNGLCEMCFGQSATTIHHMTYDRLYNEWIFDLAAICQDCHASLHPHMQG